MVYPRLNVADPNGLIERLDRIFDRFRTLKVQDLEGDEMLYRALREKYGRYFAGGKGAAAIKARLESFDLEGEAERLREGLRKISGNAKTAFNIQEINQPELDAMLLAQGVADQLAGRVSFRRAMKRAVQSAMRLGAGGIKIICSGRLGGAEIARTEMYREGRVPLHTLRADIDFGTATAMTAYGTCGVKVWVFKGEVMAHDPMAQDKRLAEQPVQSQAR